MEGRLQREIGQKTTELKIKLKKLTGSYASIFELGKRNHNNKLILLKRNIDKLKEAQMRIKNISLEDDKEESYTIAEDNASISKLCLDTLKNISKIEKLLDVKLTSENRSNNHYSKKMGNFRKNLDNLRVAYDNIRRLDSSLGFTDREWRSIEKDI